MKTIFKVMLFILVLIGCKKEQTDLSSDNLFSTVWYLQSIMHTDTQVEDLVPVNLMGMNIFISETKKLHASSSCNTFQGDLITTRSNIISIENLGTTLMLCIDESKMSWDTLFFNNLKNARSYEIIDGILTISTSQKTILTFKN